jgi:hypothetical protein
MRRACVSALRLALFGRQQAQQCSAMIAETVSQPCDATGSWTAAPRAASCWAGRALSTAAAATEPGGARGGGSGDALAADALLAALSQEDCAVSPELWVACRSGLQARAAGRARDWPPRRCVQGPLGAVSAPELQQLHQHPPGAHAKPQPQPQPHPHQTQCQSNLTPTAVVEWLGRFIVGQEDAKRAVAVAFR